MVYDWIDAADSNVETEYFDVLPAKEIVINEDSVIKLGDKKISGKNLLKIITLCERMLKDKYPEEFL